jgi:tetratricopeptide (TPR) repeat protein
LIQLAQTLTKAQEFQRAAELYETIARRLPADVGAMLNVALARFQIGRRDDALEALKRALELDPEHPTAQQLLRQWRAR